MMTNRKVMTTSKPDRIVILANGNSLCVWNWLPDYGRLIEERTQQGSLVRRVACNLVGSSQVTLAEQADPAKPPKRVVGVEAKWRYNGSVSKPHRAAVVLQATDAAHPAVVCNVPTDSQAEARAAGKLLVDSWPSDAPPLVMVRILVGGKPREYLVGKAPG